MRNKMTQAEEKAFIERNDKALNKTIDKFYHMSLSKEEPNQDYVRYSDSQILLQSVYILLDTIIDHEIFPEIREKLEKDNLNHRVIWKLILKVMSTLYVKDDTDSNHMVH